MTDLVTIGFKADTSGLTQAQTQLEKTAASGKKLDSASAANQKSLGNLGKKAGQAGIQIQQFTGQVTTGTNSLVALSQQAADLGIVLGAPLLGVFASLGATALLMASDTAEAASATDRLKDAMEELDSVASKSAGGIIELREEIRLLAEYSEQAAFAKITLGLINAQEASKAAADSVKGLFDAIDADYGFSNITTYIDALSNAESSTSRFTIATSEGFKQVARELGEEFGLVGQEAQALGDSIITLAAKAKEFPTPENFEALNTALLDAQSSAPKASEAINRLIGESQEFFSQARSAAETAEFLNGAMEDMGGKFEGSSEAAAKSSQAIDNLKNSLELQVMALEEGAQAAEVYAATQAAVANGTQEQLPEIIELINRKYELKKAQEDLAKAAQEEAKLQAELQKQNELADRAYQSILDRLDPMAAAQRKYNEELAILTAAGNTEAIELLKEEFKGLNEASEELKDSGISSLLDDVDSLTNGFSTLGDTIADAFGDAAAQLNNFAGRMNEITKLREELTEKQKSGTLTLEENQKATEALNQLNQEMYATQLGAIGGVLGASKTMFKEQSKEREVLHRLEMGFMVAEMALAAEKAVMNAVAAITNQGTGDPYTAFARIATMSALMAGVLGAAGVAFSSSSGGYDVGAVQDSQGTGTEFGDSSAKADSVIAIQERFEDIQIDQLSELRGIRDAMQGLTNGIEQLAMDIVGTGVIGSYSGDLSGSQNVSIDGSIGSLLLGGVVGLGLDKILGGAIGDIFNSVLGGLFGSTKKKLVDEGLLFEAQEIGELISGGIIDATYFATIETTKKKLFGLSKSTSTSDETTALDDAFSEQLGLIFSYLADSVSESIALLGIETENAIGDFMISIGKISFKDMTGEEIQAELEAVFSQQGDLIAKYMWPQVTEYQKLGEGALETLIRVSQEFAVFNDAIENLGLSLGELEPEQVIDASQALMDLMGGLEEFTESVSAYYDEFFTEQEKMDDLGRSLAEVFSDLNIAMPESRGEFRMLVESLDLTTEAGRALFATLMEIAPSFAEFLDGVEDLELEEAARKAAEAEAAEEARQEALSDAIDELNKAVNAEKERAAAILEAAEIAHEAEADRINGLIDALNEEKGIREQALSDATSMLQASFSVEQALIQAASSARIEALNGEIAAINQLKAVAESEYQARIEQAAMAESALQDAFGAESSSIQDSLSKQAAAISSASEARINALENEKEAAQQIASVRSQQLQEEASLLSQVASDMGSLADRLRSAVGLDAENTDVLGALMAARRGDFSLAQDLTVPTIESSGFGSASEMQFAQMVQRAQVGEIADLAGARASAAEKQLAAIERQTESMSYYSNSTIARIESQIASEKENAQAQIDKAEDIANSQIEALESQLNELLGIDESVMSVEDAIKAYLEAQAAVDEEGYNSLQAGYDEQIAVLNEQIAQDEANTQAQLDALDEQLNTLLGIDTTVLGLQEAIERYQFAKEDLDALDYDSKLAHYEAIQAAADAMLAHAEKAYNDEIDRLDAIVDNAQAQIDELNGINNSVMSVEDAIMNLTVALVGAGNGKGPDDDIIVVKPVPVDTWATMGGSTGSTQTVSKEVVEVLESIARNTATSASNSTRARTEGQQVRIV